MKKATALLLLLTACGSWGDYVVYHITVYQYGDWPARSELVAAIDEWGDWYREETGRSQEPAINVIASLSATPTLTPNRLACGEAVYNTAQIIVSLDERCDPWETVGHELTHFAIGHPDPQHEQPIWDAYREWYAGKED